MEYFESEEEFWAAFNQLKALCSDIWGWESPRAQKRHDCMFGDIINEGDTYFRKQHSQAFNAVLKVSFRSMEKLLYSTIIMSPATQKLANLLIQEKQKALDNAAKSLESYNEAEKQDV